MTATPAAPAGSQQAVVDAALLVLKSMGLSLDEPTPSEIKQLVAYVKANAVPRRNSRGVPWTTG